jgi:endonuclease/exonuclease/phosphatase family metal-dependent hydrolase
MWMAHAATAGIFLVLVLGLFSCSGPKAAVQPDVRTPAEKKTLGTSVTILSVNLAHAVKDRSDAKKIAAWIKSTGAEVVAVQQIEIPGEGKQGFNAVNELASQTEMYQFFGKARYLEGFDSGNAIFSIYPVRQSTVVSLPVSKGKVRRSLAYGVVDIGLMSIGIGCTELDDQSGGERAMQAQEILKSSTSFSDFYYFVTGTMYEPANGGVASGLSRKFELANLKLDGAAGTQQHVYAPKNTKIVATEVKRVQLKEKKLEGVLVSYQISE